MKAIILISSIFYLLGLKLSHKMDFVKSTTPAVTKVIMKGSGDSESSKSIDFKEAEALKSQKDSVQGGGTTNEVLQYR